MSVHDTIGDALTVVRNGASAKKKNVEIGYSKKIQGIMEILKEEGYVKFVKKIDFKDRKGNPTKSKLKIELKYNDKSNSVIDGIKRASTPGLRHYANVETMPRVLNGLGIAILSTNKGFMTDKSAREQNVGGEVLCYVW